MNESCDLYGINGRGTATGQLMEWELVITDRFHFQLRKWRDGKVNRTLEDAIAMKREIDELVDKFKKANQATKSKPPPA